MHIDVKDLTFGYAGREPVLRHLNMQLTNGARCLLIGANGAGKSTILRILSGRHLTKPDGAVTVLGRSAFHDTRLNFERSYLDTDWGMRTVAFAGYGCPLQADIPVYGMMEKLQAEYPERRDTLLKLLGVDLQWRMHQVSDGQRRRVQIFLGLIRPFKILLLDEVTVSLDVVVRQDLLRWLKTESETRGATILYATHIFDGLDDWPTHLHYMCNKGHTGWQGKIGDLGLYQEMRAKGEPSPLLRIAEHWLRKELEEKEAAGELREEASGPAAMIERDPLQTTTTSGGGFAAGRMAAYDFIG
ncbi:P-loop containing nucleoside triphosphate hydrolase protein [Ochromonadaceae sp. CCMP2298]|nr:P-loop containing nucleoside triphosphate hydrolase protein [Ochromonadaceae sp. CCMP2298]